MEKCVAEELGKAVVKNSIGLVDVKILVLGLVFKGNCPDLRSARVIDVIDELNQ